MSDFTCSSVGWREPQLASLGRFEKRSHCAFVSAVALGAIALIVIGLLASLHQNSVLYAQLGTEGAYVFSILGGSVLLGVLFILSRHRYKNCQNETPLSRTASTFSLGDEMNDTGSMIIHKRSNRTPVYAIDFEIKSDLTSKRTTYSSSEHEQLAAATDSEKEEISVSINKFKEEFSQNARRVLNSKKSANSSQTPSLLESELLCLKEAKQHIHKNRLPKKLGIKRHRSGEHVVFEVKGLNGFIFKVSKEKPQVLKEVQKYVQLRIEARMLCEGEGLYLIRIPACSYVEISGGYVIVEELIENVYGDYHFQKSLYTWGLDQPELESYFRELFHQMLVFVCKFDFGDCKYNNIPLDQNGNAIFLDLDEWGAEEGLTKGFAQGQDDGLLSYLPEEWLGNSVREAEELLGKPLNDKAVRERIVKRSRIRQQYFEFANSKGIKFISDPLSFTRENSEAPRRAAEALCEEINEQLKQRISCDLQTGRRIELEFNMMSSFWKNNIKRKEFIKLFGYGSDTENAFVNHVPEALKLLKEKNVIFDYEYQESSTEAVVYA